MKFVNRRPGAGPVLWRANSAHAADRPAHTAAGGRRHIEHLCVQAGWPQESRRLTGWQASRKGQQADLDQAGVVDGVDHGAQRIPLELLAAKVEGTTRRCKGRGRHAKASGKQYCKRRSGWEADEAPKKWTDARIGVRRASFQICWAIP